MPTAPAQPSTRAHTHYENFGIQANTHTHTCAYTCRCGGTNFILHLSLRNIHTAHTRSHIYHVAHTHTHTTHTTHTCTHAHTHTHLWLWGHDPNAALQRVGAGHASGHLPPAMCMCTHTCTLTLFCAARTRPLAIRNAHTHKYTVAVQYASGQVRTCVLHINQTCRAIRMSASHEHTGAHTHTHTHAHTHTHTHTHTYTHTSSSAHRRPSTQSTRWSATHTHTHTHAHTHTHTASNTALRCPSEHNPMVVSWVRAHTHIPHTPARTHMQVHTHTHTRARTHTHSPP